jgi:hypothetical protein
LHGRFSFRFDLADQYLFIGETPFFVTLFKNLHKIFYTAPFSKHYLEKAKESVPPAAGIKCPKGLTVRERQVGASWQFQP